MKTAEKHTVVEKLTAQIRASESMIITDYRGLSVTQLAEPFLGHMTLGGVTKHLKVLEKAGLVTKGRDAQWRPCKINPKPLVDILHIRRNHRFSSWHVSRSFSLRVVSPRPSALGKA